MLAQQLRKMYEIQEEYELQFTKFEKEKKSLKKKMEKFFKAKIKDERKRCSSRIKQVAQFATYDNRFYDSPRSDYSEISQQNKKKKPSTKSKINRKLKNEDKENENPYEENINRKVKPTSTKSKEKKLEQERYQNQLQSLESQIDMLKLDTECESIKLRDAEWSGTYGKMMRNLRQLQSDVDSLQFQKEDL